jgi:hypothetical protein
MAKVSILIPSRNEQFLPQTVDDIFAKAAGDIEVIAVLDGYWPDPILRDRPNLVLIHRGQAQGMRPAINSAARIAKGDFFMKCDAHCMFAKGFDETLKADCDGDWVVVPRRYSLDPRDFLYVGDAAEGLVLAAEKYDRPEPLNLGSGREVRINALVHYIQNMTGFEGRIVWDASKPDGQPRRVLDSSRAKATIRRPSWKACAGRSSGTRSTALEGAAYVRRSWMTDYYVGPGGNDGNAGTSWLLRKLTLNGAEDIPVAAGDTVIVGPGAYREMLTCDVSGGNTYNAGTVAVTNGSDQVAGNGTLWLANVQAGDYFHIRYYADGNDGVTNGTATFTSAGGNFQADMVGCPIQIMTRGAYTISAVPNAQTVTLGDPNGLGWPGAGANLVYSVMSGEGHYEIESVDDNTTLTLVQPWQGRSLNGLDYLTFRAISYIADVTGENTDGVGGIVRITGSDNDQAIVRASCIRVAGRNYRVFRGFSLDSVSGDLVTENWVATTHIVIEDCNFQVAANMTQLANVGSLCWTVRRCIFVAIRGSPIYIAPATPDDTGHVIENCLPLSGNGLFAGGGGGTTIRNCTVLSGMRGIWASGASLGQCLAIWNCIITGCVSGIVAGALGEIIEDYNSIAGNSTDRANVVAGANSNAYPPVFSAPILYAGEDRLSGFNFPWQMGDLSGWSLLNLDGNDERSTDLYGIRRPATDAKNSWGATQRQNAERDTATTYDASAASVELPDAGRAQFKIPVDGAEITVSVQAYREANYAGTNPQMVVKQPGQADRSTTDAGAAGAWNELTDTFTPAADPEYIFVELVSNNTAAAGNYATYFDNLTVDSSPALGTFDEWFTGRIVFDEVAAGGGVATPIIAPSTIVR